MELTKANQTLRLCPSTQPRSQESVVFAVVGGTVQEPRLRYLEEPMPINDDSLDLSALVEPTEIFRFAAPCARKACQHFDGSKCRLVSKTVQLLSEVVEVLPPCQIRSNCQWWQQESHAACKRCPQVVTTTYHPSEEIRNITDPTHY